LPIFWGRYAARWASTPTLVPAPKDGSMRCFGPAGGRRGRWAATAEAAAMVTEAAEAVGMAELATTVWRVAAARAVVALARAEAMMAASLHLFWLGGGGGEYGGG